MFGARACRPFGLRRGRGLRRWLSTTERGKDVEMLVDAALKRVPETGWTHETILQAARDIGLSPAAHGMLPGGAAELVHRFVSRCNVETSKTIRALGKPEDMQSQEYLTKGIMTRLSLYALYREKWYQAIALQTLPQNASKSFTLSLEMADEMCFLVGDRSHDESWYAKRVGLLTVMNTAELVWLRDASEGHTSTQDYVERAIEALFQAGSRLEQVASRGKAISYITMYSASSLIRSFVRRY